MPAPTKNRNAVRHGLRAGRLPKGASYIQRETDVLRRILEDAVAENEGGDISLYRAGVLQSCIRWERHAMLCQRWLRLEAGDLTPDQRLAFSREIARASMERDKCLRELGLDKRAAADVWSTLDATPLPTVEDDSPTNGDEPTPSTPPGAEETVNGSEAIPVETCVTNEPRDDQG